MCAGFARPSALFAGRAEDAGLGTLRIGNPVACTPDAEHMSSAFCPFRWRRAGPTSPAPRQVTNIPAGVREAGKAEMSCRNVAVELVAVLRGIDTPTPVVCSSPPWLPGSVSLPER